MSGSYYTVMLTISGMMGHSGFYSICAYLRGGHVSSVSGRQQLGPTTPSNEPRT